MEGSSFPAPLVAPTARLFGRASDSTLLPSATPIESAFTSVETLNAAARFRELGAALAECSARGDSDERSWSVPLHNVVGIIDSGCFETTDHVLGSETPAWMASTRGASLLALRVTRSRDILADAARIFDATSRYEVSSQNGRLPPFAIHGLLDASASHHALAGIYELFQAEPDASGEGKAAHPSLESIEVALNVLRWVGELNAPGKDDDGWWTTYSFRSLYSLDSPERAAHLAIICFFYFVDEDMAPDLTLFPAQLAQLCVAIRSEGVGLSHLSAYAHDMLGRLLASAHPLEGDQWETVVCCLWEMSGLSSPKDLLWLPNRTPQLSAAVRRFAFLNFLFSSPRVQDFLLWNERSFTVSDSLTLRSRLMQHLCTSDPHPWTVRREYADRENPQVIDARMIMLRACTFGMKDFNEIFPNSRHLSDKFWTSIHAVFPLEPIINALYASEDGETDENYLMAREYLVGRFDHHSIGARDSAWQP